MKPSPIAAARDWLAPEALSAYANEIVRAFGAAGTFEPPPNPRARASIRDRARATLGEIRPHAAGPSLGEALGDLLEDARRGWPDRTRASQRLAELAALFEQAAFRRTKRAERARLLAQLIVLFELEPALGIGGPAPDLESHLKLVRRRLKRKDGA